MPQVPVDTIENVSLRMCQFASKLTRKQLNLGQFTFLDKKL